MFCEQHYRDYMRRCRAYKAQVLHFCHLYLVNTRTLLCFAVVSVTLIRARFYKYFGAGMVDCVVFIWSKTFRIKFIKEVLSHI